MCPLPRVSIQAPAVDHRDLGSGLRPVDARSLLGETHPDHGQRRALAAEADDPAKPLAGGVEPADKGARGTLPHAPLDADSRECCLGYTDVERPGALPPHETVARRRPPRIANRIMSLGEAINGTDPGAAAGSRMRMRGRPQDI